MKISVFDSFLAWKCPEYTIGNCCIFQNGSLKMETDSAENLLSKCCPNSSNHLKPPIIYIYVILYPLAISRPPCYRKGPWPNHRPGDTATAILLPKVADAVRGKMSPLTGRPVQVVGSLGDAEMESWIHRKSRVNWEVDMGNHWQVE